MKKFLVVTAALLSGCASGPRAYDGVLGYRLDAQPAGTRVTYVDEAKVGIEPVLGKIAKVCSARLGHPVVPASLKVLSEASFEQQVSMSVQIPIGVQSTGSQKSSSGPGQGPGAMMTTSVSQTEGVLRTMKLRKVVALCSVTP